MLSRPKPIDHSPKVVWRWTGWEDENVKLTAFHSIPKSLAAEMHRRGNATCLSAFRTRD
jgi:hypothetical protein